MTKKTHHPSQRSGKTKKDAKRTKKPAKKLGLAKYMPSNKKTNKSKDPIITATGDAEDVPVRKASHQKSEQKNLSLVDRCKNQMSSSLLRLMDEALYSSDTKNVPLDKDKFEAYHKAYALVCEKWPTKPIDYIAKFIRKRILPKSSIKKLRFADIGCGCDPLLKKKLPSKAKVMSFDLISAHEDIIEANMELLPVQDSTINCAVYSLSLMAKNLGQVLLEGKRVLKIGGSMLIVEVTSRFEGREKKFIGKLERIGLKHRSMAQLKPNGYFTFFHFTKADNESDYSNSCLNIQLKPCIYKAR